MIYLHTGVPGAGKTLFTLYLIEQMARKDSRQVYYSGIRDCVVPGWIEFGAPSKDPNTPHFTDPSDWMSLPAGSIIVIDEAQRLYRPRQNGSAVPPYVSALETHRHQGLDIVLVTQHPGLVDANVRKLVGLHRHVARSMGMQRANLYEWQNKVAEQPASPAARRDATKVGLRYPKAVFGWYKSAEMHTHKVRIPARIIIAILLVVAVPILAYVAIHRMKSVAEDPGAQQSAAKTAAAPSLVSQAKELVGLGYIASRVPEVEGLPMTAPAYKDLMKPVIAPKPVACVQSSKRCSCYTQQGTKIAQMPEGTCRSIVENGYFDDAPDRQTGQGDYFARQQRNGQLVAVADAPSVVDRDNGPRPVTIVGQPQGPWVADPHVRQNVTSPTKRQQ